MHYDANIFSTNSLPIRTFKNKYNNLYRYFLKVYDLLHFSRIQSNIIGMTICYKRRTLYKVIF